MSDNSFTSRSVTREAAARLIALVDEAGPKLATLTTP